MTEITLNQKELEQVQKFFALLDGKENRNPISFALIAKCLDLDAIKLNDAQNGGSHYLFHRLCFLPIRARQYFIVTNKNITGFTKTSRQCMVDRICSRKKGDK